MERVSATIDKETLERIRRVVGPRGVSRFLSQAARERLARMEMLGKFDELDDLDARYGAPSEELQAEVARDARQIFRR